MKNMLMIRSRELIEVSRGQTEECKFANKSSKKALQFHDEAGNLIKPFPAAKCHSTLLTIIASEAQFPGFERGLFRFLVTLFFKFYDSRLPQQQNRPHSLTNFLGLAGALDDVLQVK